MVRREPEVGLGRVHACRQAPALHNLHRRDRLALARPEQRRPRGDRDDESAVHVVLGRADHRPELHRHNHGRDESPAGPRPGDFAANAGHFSHNDAEHAAAQTNRRANSGKRAGRRRRGRAENRQVDRGVFGLRSEGIVQERVGLPRARFHAERVGQKRRGRGRPQRRLRGRVSRRAAADHDGGLDGVAEQDEGVEDALRDVAAVGEDRLGLTVV